jgi:predicted acetyltransferase
LTGELPDEQGRFLVSSPAISDNVLGYLCFVKNIPVGFGIFYIRDNHYDGAEFYIVPAMRKKNLGFDFAKAMVMMPPGCWHSKQLVSAEYATNFWRKVIGKLDEKFSESSYEDPKWGTVIRQIFYVK